MNLLFAVVFSSLFRAGLLMFVIGLPIMGLQALKPYYEGIDIVLLAMMFFSISAGGVAAKRCNSVIFKDRANAFWGAAKHVWWPLIKLFQLYAILVKRIIF